MQVKLTIGHKIIGRRKLSLSEDEYNEFVIVRVIKTNRYCYSLTNGDTISKNKTDEYYKNHRGGKYLYTDYSEELLEKLRFINKKNEHKKQELPTLGHEAYKSFDGYKSFKEYKKFEKCIKDINPAFLKYCLEKKLKEINKLKEIK